MHEPVLAGDVRLGVIVEEAGMVEVHAAIRRHAAVLRLEWHVAAGMDANAPVVDGIAEQQRGHGDFACGERAPALRMQAAKRHGIHRLMLQS